jgi:hypothetical protein
MAKHDENEGVHPRLTSHDVEKLRPVGGTGGRQHFPSLPSLITNSFQGLQDPAKICDECRASPYFDREGYTKNRILGKAFEAALNFFKPGDKDGPQFILQWRLYPNKEHPRFREIDGCSCGCGGDSLGHHHPKP